MYHMTKFTITEGLYGNICTGLYYKWSIDRRSSVYSIDAVKNFGIPSYISPDNVIHNSSSAIPSP